MEQTKIQRETKSSDNKKDRMKKKTVPFEFLSIRCHICLVCVIICE